MGDQADEVTFRVPADAGDGLEVVRGPPPEEWRGGIRTSRRRAHGDPFHAGPRLGRGAVAQGRAQALPVVEDLDVLEHRRPGLRPGAEADVVDVLLLERGEEALHRRVDAPMSVK